MTEDIEGEDDVALLTNDDGDDRLLMADDRRPRINAVFVVTFDIKYGKRIHEKKREKQIFHS